MAMAAVAESSPPPPTRTRSSGRWSRELQRLVGHKPAHECFSSHKAPCLFWLCIVLSVYLTETYAGDDDGARASRAVRSVQVRAAAHRGRAVVGGGLQGMRPRQRAVFGQQRRHRLHVPRGWHLVRRRRVDRRRSRGGGRRRRRTRASRTGVYLQIFESQLIIAIRFRGVYAYIRGHNVKLRIAIRGVFENSRGYFAKMLPRISHAAAAAPSVP
jgi:hypothetical protein